MVLFLIGLAILLVGGLAYGKYCERVFGPDDRETPAVKLADGLDYVGMKKWKNQLIELLNIAGTGPILGPIQGILFGPIAFLTIPIGCVLAGSLHDYFVGMISMRNDGAQVPKLVTRYLGNGTNKVYNIIIWILMLLTGVVFIYTPGDLIVNDVLGMDIQSNVIWIVYACILGYYILATLFPIDAIIGRVYPIFGGFLILSALGVLVGVLMDGGASLHPITEGSLLSVHPTGQSFIPVFFITVACGIMSGFHGSQATLISRTVMDEREGRQTFYNMMLAEGFIAMVWAAGAMVLFNRSAAVDTSATLMVGLISKEFMGKIGGLIAIIGVIVLPITSGDTAFRSLRLMIAEQFNIDQGKKIKRVLLSILIFIPAVAILYYAKTNSEGFATLWRYFGFANQLVAVFALLMVSTYLKGNGKNYFISLLPGMFYTFIVSSYIFHDPKLGLNFDGRLGLEGYTGSYLVGLVFAILFAWFVAYSSKKRKDIILD
ncbi:carbon starvation protein CstA domain protein [Peptoniphilus sp. oral taxon 375 str. F0436]|uniref:carbon starvation CstA family protein n=1 Tax=Urinicoccus timonensis TaxID=2024205 RepID=UPI00021A34FF|nr:carbon starvation CstA family protein [Urinicoccus timonensis]EGS30888.1 carbon starvation protein CstA domain protein [Peptoniphilus sp. oral taxon 375 str. F0436]